MVTFTVNGERKQVEVGRDTPLLWVLREHLGLTGTKFGCGIAACGACTVHLDGEPVRPAPCPSALVEGHAVTTIEGLSPDGSHPLQKAWVAEQVPQCGYCQSGQIMHGPGLLAENKKPSRDEIVEHMNGNICRCGTYLKIISRDPARGAGGLSHDDLSPDVKTVSRRHSSPEPRASRLALTCSRRCRWLVPEAGGASAPASLAAWVYDRARQHHHDRVAGRRDGTRHLHGIGGHAGRRTRRRLVDGQGRAPSDWMRRPTAIRYYHGALFLHFQRDGSRILQADADRRRAGAARAASTRWRRNGPSRLGDSRPSRAWSCTSLDRRHDYGEIASFAKPPADPAQDQRQGAQADEEFRSSARTFRGSSCRRRSRARRSMRSMSRFPGCSMPRFCIRLT